jgi:hypothetical protein
VIGETGKGREKVPSKGARVGVVGVHDVSLLFAICYLLLHLTL